eukprot:9211482-Lingulodinium_polyedra.AAC.1
MPVLMTCPSRSPRTPSGLVTPTLCRAPTPPIGGSDRWTETAKFLLRVSPFRSGRPRPPDLPRPL